MKIAGQTSKSEAKLSNPPCLPGDARKVYDSTRSKANPTTTAATRAVEGMRRWQSILVDKVSDVHKREAHEQEVPVHGAVVEECVRPRVAKPMVAAGILNCRSHRKENCGDR